MYSFKLPGTVVWVSHILMGAFLFYYGYLTLNNKPIPQLMSIALIVMGALALFYHLHLWYYHTSHNNESLSNTKKIVTTFRGGTYDVTDFVKNHPGGSVIKKAAGKDLDEVWSDNGVGWHKNNTKVMNILKKYKIK